MIRALLLLIIVFTTSINAATFSQSKKILLKQIYFDNQNTFYCNNPYEIKQVKGKEQALIIQDEKYYSPRKPFSKSGKPNVRATRVEWEHVMPAHNFGQHLPCWKEGGRKACQKDKTFQTMESDRSNYKYGANKPKLGQYGQCSMEIDFKAKRAYVKDDIRGDIARIYFYMSDKYNINLSKQERKMMEAWDKEDPVSEWEKIKNKRVEKIQGNSNNFIN